MTVIQLRDLFATPTSTCFETSSWMVELGTDDHVVLDLAESDSQRGAASKLRLDTIRVSVLANLISSLDAKVEIVLTLPDDDSLRRQLARTPLLAVLASRVGVVLEHPQLAPWTSPWNPHDASQLRQQLDAADRSINPSQRYLLTLIAPHLRASQGVQREVRGIVDPWLGRRFIARGRSAERSVAMRDLEQSMAELTENVGDHAFPDDLERSPMSTAQLMTTAGGTDSVDRFRVIVMDNGIGLAKSVKRRRGDLNGATALLYALTGQLRHGDRGRGLPNVRNIVQRYEGSSFLLLTELFPERSRSLAAFVDDRGEVVVNEVPLPLRGTLAVGQLAMPALADIHPELFEPDDTELVMTVL